MNDLNIRLRASILPQLNSLAHNIWDSHNPTLGRRLEKIIDEFNFILEDADNSNVNVDGEPLKDDNPLNSKDDGQIKTIKCFCLYYILDENLSEFVAAFSSRYAAIQHAKNLGWEGFDCEIKISYLTKDPPTDFTTKPTENKSEMGLNNGVWAYNSPNIINKQLQNETL